MASSVSVHIVLSKKSRDFLQRYMTDTGAADVSHFLVEAIKHDFASFGIGDLCDDKWVGRDEKTPGGSHVAVVGFSGKMAGHIRAQQIADSRSKWVHDALDNYLAFLDRPRITPRLTAESFAL